MAEIIHLARTPHDETQLLLPWYVNDTLDPDEAELVEAHLAECAECRLEAEAERALRRDIADLPTGDGRDRAAPSNPLDRAPPFEVAFLRRRISLGWALAGQLAAAAALVLAFYMPSSPEAPGATYQALGSPGGQSAGNLVLMFDPGLSERRIRAAMLRVDGQIVGGPNASGAYVVSVPPAERPAALDRLRSMSDVVLAEPIDRGGPG